MYVGQAEVTDDDLAEDVPQIGGHREVAAVVALQGGQDFIRAEANAGLQGHYRNSEICNFMKRWRS